MHDTPPTDTVEIDLRTDNAQFSVGADGATPVIGVAGTIDLASVEALAGCLSAFDAGDDLIVDVSNLSFIDHVGVVVLTSTRDRGVRVICRGARGPVRRALDSGGLDAVATPECLSDGWSASGDAVV